MRSLVIQLCSAGEVQGVARADGRGVWPGRERLGKPSVIIYNKYIFGLRLVPGTELLKPLEFPVKRALKASCYVNEVTWKAPEDGVGDPTT